jgi:hypothetical protein
MLQRKVNIVTANLGRGVNFAEFRDNVDKIIKETPGTNRFFQFQEIGEADFEGDRELDYLKKKLSDTHRFAGLQTHVPIAIPRTFKVSNRAVTVATEGVDHLSPRRHVVQAYVSPMGHPDEIVCASNTHFPRDAPALSHARTQSDEVLRERLDQGAAGWLTADLNSQRYPKLSKNEIRLVDARLDVIRAYERNGVSIERLNTGSIDLTIDGHNAHWARVLITWS